MKNIKIKEIFLQENATLNDLMEKLDSNAQKISNALLKSLEIIFINHNDLIGYAKFEVNKQKYNIYIFPKIIPFSGIPNDTQKQLYKNYLVDFYKLLTKYEKIKKTKLNFSKQCSINSEKNFGDFFDSLLDNQYKYALSELTKFINKFHIKQNENINFYSQSVSDKIDILQNILEFNKSRIHQIQEKQNNRHIKIDCILAVLNRFIEINETISENKKIALNLKRIISNKFETNKISYQNILSKKFFQLFANDNEIYTCLLILLGKEAVFNNGVNVNCNFVDNLEAIFFKPADVFEYFVLDYLNEKHSPKLDVHYHKNFEYIIKDNNQSQKFNATPDFIVKYESDIEWIYDSKWKILEDNQFPEIEDLIKLEKDSNVIKNLYNFKINNSALVYPCFYGNANRKVSINFLPNFQPELIYVPVLRS
jgi:hypothetical protein